jgi:two-component system sensor histidine kinase DesK
VSNETFAAPGQAPGNRRQFFIKLTWVGIWLAFMGAPIDDLLSRTHTAWALVLGWTGLVVFVAAYLGLLLRHTGRPPAAHTVNGTLFFLFGLSVVLSLGLGSHWLVLFVYVSVASGASLGPVTSRWAVLAVTAAMVLIGIHTENAADFLSALVIPALLGGFAMSGVGQLVRTTIELREARVTVAELAANEERLRLARDLHDLLGHSLSLITLKSELAGRMLPEHPDRAAEQVADIERVSRQALMDVREAVTGYRRPTLSGELAGARTALAVAGVAAEVPSEGPAGFQGAELCDESETVLAWSLREAVTNVVRHSGASRCAVSLTPRQTLEGPMLELTVEDDGRGASGSAHGNGLTGLTERLAGIGGSLETGTSRSGFVLTVRAPLGVALAPGAGPALGSGA